MEEGAALQPLSVAVHACSRAGVKIGTTVAILGAGPIGVLCAMTAKAMGATAVLLTGGYIDQQKTQLIFSSE